MKRSTPLLLYPLILFFLLVAAPNGVLAVTLPAFFSDHMVLQRQETVLLWGWGKPLEKVTVETSWSEDKLETEVSNQGRWSVNLQTPEAGGPHSIAIQGHNRVEIKDILIGEVWVCSGQSNMEWSARMGINRAGHEISMAAYPNIRFFTVRHRTADSPQVDLRGEWTPCSPETMIDFSAVAYFFARKLQQELNVPIGLINASWGGTPAEAWTPAPAVEQDPVLAKAAGQLREVPWGPIGPGKIYNAMVAPLVPFRIAGAIWYQGESNVSTASTYRQLFSTMIRSWRSAWGYDFPFYFVQIAPYRYGEGYGGAQLRDAQRRTLEVPSTGMVVTSDIGDTTDIHPRNKQDVGLRLAKLALSRRYQTTEETVSGPLFRSFQVQKNKVRISFDHAEGLHARGGEPTHFEIAGPDKVFYPAQAEIRDNAVVVFSDRVRSPVAVRFAWGNTAEPNLFNGAGLPASCFTTE